MSSGKLLINQKSRQQLDLFAKNPVGAIILNGQKGVGLGTIAKEFAREIAKNEVFVLAPSLHKNQKTKTINTDDTRKISDLAKSIRKKPLVVIIDEAEKIVENAWQPLLKILEEPAKNLYFILTSHNTAKIPATILSRTQKIEVLPAPVNDDFIEKKSALKVPEAKKVQLRFLAGNLPAEMARLLSDENYFREKSGNFSIAKEFLIGETGAKLVSSTKIKNREDAQELIENIAKILMLKPGRNFAKSMKTLAETSENISRNANVKAQLLNLSINLQQ